VSVIQGGSPGSKPTVLIRGIPSFSGTDPVVIVDGVGVEVGRVLKIFLILIR
jgi:hypothetical protein